MRPQACIVRFSSASMALRCAAMSASVLFALALSGQLALAQTITSRTNPDMCFHKRSGGWANGNAIHLWECRVGGPENKSWYFDSDTGYIRGAENPAKCLHKRDGGFDNGNPIHVWDCDAGGPENKTWRVDSSQGFIQLAANPSKCLHKRDGGFRNGNPIHLWDCAPGPAENKTWAISTRNVTASPPPDPVSSEDQRYADIMKAARCMDFTDGLSGDHITGVPLPGDNDSVRFQAQHVVRVKSEYRPHEWRAGDLLGDDFTGFEGEFFRRYRSPPNMDDGTYNLTFTVISDSDEIFLCLLGTEPHIYPTIEIRGGRPHIPGNSLNNLMAEPVVYPPFDDVARVHYGWAEVARYYRGVILPILQRRGLANKKLHVTGHSQGAVLAGYLAFLLVKNGDLPRSVEHRLVTLSAPRYGTDNFIPRFDELRQRNAPLMTVDALETQGDIVPRSWPLATIPVGRHHFANAREVGYMVDYNAVSGTNPIFWHLVYISQFHAQRLVDTRGQYRGPSVDLGFLYIPEIAVPDRCPAGHSRSAAWCVKDGCDAGYTRVDGNCLSNCPSGSNYSLTRVHCITDTRAATKTNSRHWVGHLKPQADYRNACTGGSKYTHDLAGYAHCVSYVCPQGYPTRKGENCHRSCGSLASDAFGNCVVETKPPPTAALECPGGYRKYAEVSCLKDCLPNYRPTGDHCSLR